MEDGERLAAEMARLRRQAVRGRDWPRVRLLGGVSAAMLIASLVADEWLHAPKLAALAFLAGIATGAVMFTYAFNRWLFVDKPPVE